LLIGGLALTGGGFELADRHIAGLAVWLLVAALLALGAAGRASSGKPFYWGTGLVLALAVFSGLSSFWSGSVELSVTEADRVLVYLGVLLAAFLIAQTDQRRQRFAEGVVFALIFVGILGLATRLLPHVFPVAEGLGSGPRLRYPLGYWNANGVACGIAAALIPWLSRRSLTPALRWLAVACLPAMLLTLYFTYSRGGVLALLVAGGCLVALSHDRLWMLGTLAIGVLGALPAVLAVQARNSLADNVDNAAAVDQGLTVLLILLTGTALTLGLFALMRRLASRRGTLTDRAVTISRDPRALRAVAIGFAVLALVAAVAVGGRAWDQFSSSDIEFPNQPQQHFTDVSGAGRHDFYRVALDAFGEAPVAGNGAGTYQFSWVKLRSLATPVHNAHSLYLEAFAELGLVGGLLVLGMVGFLLWTGFSAWRHSSGIARERNAALLAAALALALGMAIDWFWEITALGAVFFLATGALLAARCGQLVSARAGANGRGENRGIGFAIGGLALAWLTALALIGPLLVDREIDASQAAAAEGNLGVAVERAKTARSIEPWAASPYKQLGLLAEIEGDYATAAGQISKAIDREEGNWLLYYVRARIEHESGNEAAAMADRARAQELNPLEPCLQEGWDGCG
jgi:O-antigen ligase/polysaccharide polymerase Wzy-like membrane protein